MIGLLEDLPDAVEVAGTLYPIHTDYRDWVRFERLLQDDEVPEEEKPIIMLSWYTEHVPEDFVGAINGLIHFFLCGHPPDETGEDASGSGGAAVVYDYEKDAELIFTSFLHAYGLDLAEVEHLHWWKFRALLLNIPEGTRLATVMGYRSADDKDLTEHQRRIKRLYDLGRTRGRGPATLAERDRGLIERAKRARQRAGMD